MRAAVIGAGPTGLAVARHLDDAGFEVVGFEVHDNAGGLWDIDSPTSTLYDSAHLISSTGMTEFVDYPMPREFPPYPHHTEVAAYLRGYARHFELDGLFHYGTRVTDMAPLDQTGATGGWEVTTSRDGSSATVEVDAVVIATGTFHHPNMPEWPGSFDGDLVHSSAHRDPDLLTDRHVLVVGCGNSGADIAVEAVHHAASVDLSVRRGYYFLPKFVMGRPIDTLGGAVGMPRAVKQRVHAMMIRLVVGRPSDYGLPDPDYLMYESHPVLNTQVLHHIGHGDITPRPDITRMDGHTVTFADGTTSDHDLVIAATGYTLDYPFIDHSLLHWQRHAPALYLNTFHPGRDDLAMAGMVEASGLGFEGRNQQARLIAAHWRGLAEGNPAAHDLRATIRARATQRATGGYDYLDLERMAFYVAKDEFLTQIAGHLDDLAAGTGRRHE